MDLLLLLVRKGRSSELRLKSLEAETEDNFLSASRDCVMGCDEGRDLLGTGSSTQL